MKRQIIFSIVTLFTVLITFEAKAQGCGQASQEMQRENAAVEYRNGALNRLNHESQADQELLRTQLLPQQSSADHNLKTYEYGKETLGRAQQAIRQVILYLQGSIVLNNSLKSALEELHKNLNPTAGTSLADHMRELARNGKLKRKTIELLSQLANAVELFESTTTDWQEAEKKILEQYLNGVSFVDALYSELNQVNERLTSSLNELVNAQSADQSRADECTKSVNDAQARVAARVAQIQQLQMDNAASMQRLKIVVPIFMRCLANQVIHGTHWHP